MNVGQVSLIRSRCVCSPKARAFASLTDSTMSFFIDCFINRIAGINQPALLKQLLALDLQLEDIHIGGMVKGNRSGCFTPE